MFGERYFATRKRLARVTAEIRHLAEAIGLELEGFADDSELLQGLRNPYLFVVSGEVNAGKSTLINGLLGAELCEVNILPETDRVLWYRYGNQENVRITPELEERYREIDFLQDFNIVDTPGTNSVRRGHQEITERFLPVADLVLFVFPVSNPWGAATWDFIARFPEELKGKVAFILQQKDLRDEGELKIIVEHMRQLARQKLGEEPEVFAVSGKMAMEAKQREPFEERGWRQSGFPALEDYISGVVTGSPGRKQVLRDVRDAALNALGGIEDRIEERARDLEEQVSFLRALDEEVEALRDNYGGDRHKSGGLGEIFLAEAAEALMRLQRRLGLWSTVRSLFRRDETPAAIEKELSKAGELAVQELMWAEAKEMEELCLAHWAGAVPRLQERLGVAQGPLSGGVDFMAARDRLVKKMGRSARQAIYDLKLRGVLELQMEARRVGLRRLVAVVLFLVSLGGGLGAFGVHPWSWVAIAAAGVLSIAGVWKVRRSRLALVSWFAIRLERSQEAFVESLWKTYHEGVGGFFSDYARMLEGGRKVVSTNKEKIKPRLKEWNSLYVELKAIEQEL